jgi:hypothetical protein
MSFVDHCSSCFSATSVGMVTRHCRNDVAFNEKGRNSCQNRLCKGACSRACCCCCCCCSRTTSGGAAHSRFLGHIQVAAASLGPRSSTTPAQFASRGRTGRCAQSAAEGGGTTQREFDARGGRKEGECSSTTARRSLTADLKATTPQMSVHGQPARAYPKNNDVKNFAGFQDAAGKENEV